jgi:hypothetical protein
MIDVSNDGHVTKAHRKSLNCKERQVVRAI